MNCPKCGEEDLARDEVDVEVGVIYGPYGCHACGWSEDSRYDSSNGPSPAQLESLDRYVDSCGSSHSIERFSEKLERFGIPRDLTEDVFKVKEK